MGTLIYCIALGWVEADKEKPEEMRNMRATIKMTTANKDGTNLRDWLVTEERSCTYIVQKDRVGTSALLTRDNLGQAFQTFRMILNADTPGWVWVSKPEYINHMEA